MKNKTIDFYRNILIPLYTVFIPFIFLWIVHLTARGLFPRLQRVPDVMIVWALIVGMLETIIGNVLYKEKVGGFLPRLREFVLILALSALLLFLLNGDLFRGNIRIFKAEVIYPIAAVSLQWFLSYLIHSQFQKLELLFRAAREKQLAEYKNVVRDFGSDISEIINGIKSIRKICIGLLTLSALAVFTASVVYETGLPANLSVLMIVYFFFSLLLIMNTHSLLEDIKFWSEDGIRTSETRKPRFMQTAAVLMISALLTLPFLTKDPFLPGMYLERVYDWIQAQTELEDRVPPGGPRTIELEAEETRVGADRSIVSGAGRSSEESAAGDIVRIIIIIFAVGIPVLILLLTLIKPLFKKQKLSFSLAESAKNWFQNFFRSIKEGIKNLKTIFTGGKDRGGRYSRIRELFESKKESRQSHSHRKGPAFLRRIGLPRELKSFLKIIKWGEKKGIRFKPSLGPAEYTGMIAQKVPEATSLLGRISLLLETYLFSREGLSEELVSEYHKNIEDTVKQY